MPMSTKAVHMNAVHVSDHEKESDGRIHHTWVAPTLFNLPRFINDPRYFQGDRTLQFQHY